MSGTDKIRSIESEFRNNIVPALFFALFFGYVLIMFAYNMFCTGQGTDYLNVVTIWAGFGRYLFLILIFYGFLKKEDDCVFWTVAVGIGYILQFLLAFLFCLRFTSASFMLFMDLAAYFFVYAACPAVTAWLIGRVCRSIRHDVLSVVAVLVLGSVFLFNIVQEVLLFPVFQLNEHTYTILGKAFMIFNHSLRETFVVPDVFAPFAVNITDFAKAVFWIGLFALILGIIRKKKRMFALAVPVLICVVLICFDENKFQVYFSQSCLQNNSKMLDSWNGDQIYYLKREFYLKNHKPIRAETNFLIEGYHLELTPGLKTKFKAVLQLSEAEVSEYVFTLYHGYKVRSVTDMDGSALSFSQQDDIVIVSSGGKPLREITMEYDGTGQTYMASAQYTCLPQYYIYYPVAGRYTLYDVLSMGYARNMDLPEAEFTIVVHADYDVYSNIPRVEHNTFAGRGTGATLVGGKYLRACEENGVSIVYSVLSSDEAGARSQYQNLVRFYEENQVDFTNKAWFACPYYDGHTGRYYVGDNYLFGSYTELMTNMPLTYGIPSSEILRWME